MLNPFQIEIDFLLFEKFAKKRVSRVKAREKKEQRTKENVRDSSAINVVLTIHLHVI